MVLPARDNIEPPFFVHSSCFFCLIKGFINEREVNRQDLFFVFRSFFYFSSLTFCRCLSLYASIKREKIKERSKNKKRSWRLTSLSLINPLMRQKKHDE